MNRQEIVQILDSPTIPDFPTLYAMCQDPEGLERVLSLTIAKVEMKVRADVYNTTNKALHEVKNVVGYVLL